MSSAPSGPGGRSIPSLSVSAEALLVERVDVAELDAAAVRRRLEVVEIDALELPVAHQRVAQGELALLVLEVGEQAVGREDGQAGVLEGDQAGEHVAVRPLCVPISSA